MTGTSCWCTPTSTRSPRRVAAQRTLVAAADAGGAAASRPQRFRGNVVASGRLPRRDTDERSRSVSAETSGLTQPVSAAPEPIAAGGSVHQESYARRPATCVTEDGQPISASTVLRMLCDSPAQLLVTARDGRPLDLGRTSRNADRRQRRALRVRDGGFCRFPGCSQRHRLIPHHTRWWSRGGRTDLDLLVSLCPTHHLAVHELGYDVTAQGRRPLRLVPAGRSADQLGADARRRGGGVARLGRWAGGCGGRLVAVRRAADRADVGRRTDRPRPPARRDGRQPAQRRRPPTHRHPLLRTRPDPADGSRLAGRAAWPPTIRRSAGRERRRPRGCCARHGDSGPQRTRPGQGPRAG